MTKLKHRTIEDGRRIQSDWKKSGLTQAKFAKQIGISVAVIRYWISRIRKLQEREDKPVPVRFVEVVSKKHVVSPKPSILELPGGLRLSTPDLPPPQYIAELSAACQRKPSC